jgi:hypothetical protein
MTDSYEPGGQPGPERPQEGQVPPTPPPGYAQAPYGQPPYGYGPPPGYGWPGYGPGGQAASAPGGIPLRPLALGDIYSGALTSARRNPVATFGIAAILATIYAILNFGTTLFVRAHNTAASFSPSGNLQPAHPSSAGLLDIPVYLVSLILQAILTGMLAAVIGSGILGRKLTIGQAWREVRIGSLIGAAGLLLLFSILPFVPVALLVTVFVVAHAGVAAAGLGAILGLGAFVGYIIIGVRLCLTMPAVVLERLGPWQAIRRSWRLSRGSSWRLFGIKLLTLVIIGIATIVIEIPFLLAGGSFAVGGVLTALRSATVLAVLLTVIGALVASTLMQPMKTGVSVLLYLDTRMRREGFDLALRNAAERQQLTDDDLAEIWRAPAAPPSMPGQWPSPAPGSWPGQPQWPSPAGQWPSPAGQWQPPGPTPQQDPPALQ